MSYMEVVFIWEYIHIFDIFTSAPFMIMYSRDLLSKTNDFKVNKMHDKKFKTGEQQYSLSDRS